MEKDKIDEATTPLPEKTKAETVLGNMPDYNEHIKSFSLPSKDEVRVTIREELDSDKKIESFVNDRIRKFEFNTEEKTVGQNYTDSFRDFISSKIHYKSTDRLLGNDSPDLVYDDIQPYMELITQLHKNGNYNIPTLCNNIFNIIDNYLPSHDKDGFGRLDVYFGNANGKVSIKDISGKGVAFCSEKAGLSHNMFKMLSIDSETVVGAREKEPHAYNLIYPNGYNDEPVILYDPSHFIDFVNDNGRRISLGFFKALSNDELQKLKSGEPVKFEDLSMTEKSYRKQYNLEGYHLVNKTATYVYGAKSAEKYLSTIQ